MCQLPSVGVAHSAIRATRSEDRTIRPSTRSLEPENVGRPGRKVVRLRGGSAKCSHRSACLGVNLGHWIKVFMRKPAEIAHRRRTGKRNMTTTRPLGVSPIVVSLIAALGVFELASLPLPAAE
jgi:hypothetical protein